MTGRDVTGGDGAGGADGTGREDGWDAAGGDEEAAWRELVAHYDAPADDDHVPWPERENLPGTPQIAGLAPEALPRGVESSGRAGQQPPADQGAPRDQVAPREQGTPRDQRTPREQGAPGTWRQAAEQVSGEPDPAEEHYVPPPPPPLPKLDPITKGAWLALFGGPAYLLIATAIGWAVPGIAAFCAVAAFVGGFAVLVLRMDGGPPRGSGSGPDNGAVV